MNNSWWPTKRTERCQITQVPQASAALDALCCLEPRTKVVFAGLSGGINEKLKIGDIYEVNSCFIAERFIEKSLHININLPNINLAHVSCLAESYGLKQKPHPNVDCVDMETGYIYLAAPKLFLEATSLVIISDNCPNLPFYAIDPIKWSISIALLCQHLQQAGIL